MKNKTNYWTFKKRETQLANNDYQNLNNEVQNIDNEV